MRLSEKEVADFLNRVEDELEAAFVDLLAEVGIEDDNDIPAAVQEAYDHAQNVVDVAVRNMLAHIITLI